MKKTFFALLAGVAFCSAAFANADGESLSTEQLDRIEKTVYGSVHTGGMLSRLDDIEKDLYGSELQGTLLERQSAHVDFIENGSNGQPSLLFKTSVAEWGLEIPNNAAQPLVDRVPLIEKKLEASALDSRPLAMRIERALGKIVSDPVTADVTEVPVGTVARLQLMETLKPAKTKKGDVVLFRATHNIIVNNALVVPVGAPAEGVVLSVKKPGAFGRPSQIKIAVKSLKTLGGATLPLTQGEASKKATEFEASYAAAAGTSLVGAMVLGPVGLVSGFFIRGNAKDVPAGSIMYAETEKAVSVPAYPIPDSLKAHASEKQYVDLIEGKKVDSVSMTDGQEKLEKNSKDASRKKSEIDSL
ncbi:MAG: hypothetical protein ACOYD9_02720 [Pyramidobacter sp.]|jgi:hypothetical protein